MPIPEFLAALRRQVGHQLVLVPTVVVVARDPAGRLLLVHDRDSGLWTLPGGIVEPGQTPADAAVREVWEEARVHATLTHLVGVFGGEGCETTYRNGDRIAWVATVFGARLAEGLPAADGDEALDARLVAPQALHGLALKPEAEAFLRADGGAGSPAYFARPGWRPHEHPEAEP